MASSTQNIFTTTATSTSAPPPTPSTTTHHHHLPSSSAATLDALSRLLHRLPPPTLSLPTRHGNNKKTTSLSITSSPLISLSDDPASISDRLQLGYFQLKEHSILPSLTNSAELDSLSLFKLSKDEKHSCFPKEWPLGYEENDEDEKNESFWLDGECSTSSELSTELSLSSLRELTRDLKKIGLDIVEMLSKAVGFDNPFKKDPNQVFPIMLVHEGCYGDKLEHVSGEFYPYVVGLEYQIRSRKYSVLTESGWVTVSPEVESVMVTIGDIAQVWSNGKLKKIRGRALPCMGDSNPITMTLLLTLPLDAIVSPLMPNLRADDDEAGDDEDGEVKLEEEEIEENNGKNIIQKEKRLFSSFSLEDYAWRVYHEPLLFKDPLHKYRISS